MNKNTAHGLNECRVTLQYFVHGLSYHPVVSTDIHTLQNIFQLLLFMVHINFQKNYQTYLKSVFKTELSTKLVISKSRRQRDGLQFHFSNDKTIKKGTLKKLS